MSIAATRKAAPRLLTLLLLLLLLAACSPIDPTATFTTAPQHSGSISGTVAYRARISLPAGAQVQVELVDVTSEPFTVLAAQTVVTQGAQPPVAFTLAYDPAAVETGRQYGLTARIVVKDEITFSLPGYARVLSQNAPRNNVDLLLQQGGATMEPSQPGQLRGTVTYLSRMALPLDSLVIVELIDLSATPLAVLDEQRIRTQGEQVPVPYLLEFDPGAIDPEKSYGVAARIVIDGKVAWFAEDPTPVLTGSGPADNVEILLRAAESDSPLQHLSGVIEGRIIHLQRIALPPDAMVELNLSSVEGNQTTLVKTLTFPTEGRQSPISFTLEYSPDIINVALPYELSARILAGGQPLFDASEPKAVLTLGAAATDIDLMIGRPERPQQGNAAVSTATATPVPAPPTATPQMANVTGRLLIRERIALPAGTVVEAQLLDLSQSPPTVLDEYVVTTTGEQAPFPFVLRYAVNSINPAALYAVDARVVLNGEDHWVAPELTAVISGNAPREGVMIVLVANEEFIVQPTAEATAEPEATPPVEDPAAEAGEQTTPTAAPTQAPAATPTVMPTRAPTASVAVTVSANDAANLPEGAVITVQLSDAAGGILAEEEQVVAAGGEALTFSLPYDGAAVNEEETYVVRVRLAVDGQTLFATGRGFPVITGGAPTSIDVLLD